MSCEGATFGDKANHLYQLMRESHLPTAASCLEYTVHDVTGRQPDEIVTGKERAELLAMTLMLWYPESRFTIISTP